MFSRLGCLFVKVAKLLSRLAGNYQVYFLSKLVSIKGMLWVHLCFDRRCEGCFINGVVCKRPCFVWGIIRWGYRQVQVMEKMQYKEQYAEQKVCSYYLGRKVVFHRWILVVSVVNELVEILISVQNVKSGFTVVALLCLGRWIYYRVRMSLSEEHILVRIVQ